jgi:hypothetical protein
MAILCMLTILLHKYCRGHTKCSRPRNWHYTTILNDRKHSWVQFMHTVTTAMPVNLLEEWPFYAFSLYCSANIASRGHAECSRPQTQPYTTIFDDRKHSGLLFMHTVVNAITIRLPEQCPFFACSLYCLANIAGVIPNVLSLGTVLPYSMAEKIEEAILCIL